MLGTRSLRLLLAALLLCGCSGGSQVSQNAPEGGSGETEERPSRKDSKDEGRPPSRSQSQPDDSGFGSGSWERQPPQRKPGTGTPSSSGGQGVSRQPGDETRRPGPSVSSQKPSQKKAENSNPPKSNPSATVNRPTQKGKAENSSAGKKAPARATATGRRGTDPGDSLPEISGRDFDGQPFKLSDYRGKVIMVDFWGDW